MSDIVEKAFDAVRRMPLAERETMAQAILALAGNEDGPLDIDPAHLQDVLAGLAEIERGDLASEEEVAAAFGSFER